MSKTATIVLAAVLAVVLALAVAVKVLFFPSVKEVYFAATRQTLLKVPAGLTVIRPTHFPLHREAIIYAAAGKDSGSTWRMSGRNVPLLDLIATAYGETRGRVVLPFAAPTNGFDFVVTAAKPRPSLQKAIRDTLRYTADEETNDTDVLALKVVDPALPGMTASPPGEKPNTSLNKGKLIITHILLKDLTPGFEQILKTPVVDETSLTNYYDLSLEWNRSMGARLQNQATARPLVDKILNGWGLALESDTAPIEVLIVKKVY